MQQYQIVLGDWSDDGHGKTETHTVVIHGDVTQEQLAENYKRNVERVGFNPVDTIAVEYDEPYIYEKDVHLLAAAGFTKKVVNEKYRASGRTDAYYIDNDDLVHIIMYFFLDGLEGTRWEELKEKQLPTLVGGYSAVVPYEQYGYGLFS
jgi:hypothetical protein